MIVLRKAERHTRRNSGIRPLVSVVVPAKNEEQKLPETLRALREIRNSEYSALEIVVGVGASEDRTEAIALEFADKVVPVGHGPSCARNQAAEAAAGEILIFLDADAKPLLGTVSKIVECTQYGVVGTCAMRPDVLNWKSRMLAWFKNLVRYTLHRGCSELIFCHRNVFFDNNVRFDENRKLGELHEFFRRAMRVAKAEYHFLWEAQYEFSVRRHEETGYLRVALFWLRWYILGKLPTMHERLEREYWVSRAGKS